MRALVRISRQRLHNLLLHSALRTVETERKVLERAAAALADALLHAEALPAVADLQPDQLLHSAEHMFHWSCTVGVLHTIASANASCLRTVPNAFSRSRAK